MNFLNSTNISVVKMGSFQEYADYSDFAGDVGRSLFPAQEVHKIGVLDIRIVNTDRNVSFSSFVCNFWDCEM